MTHLFSILYQLVLALCCGRCRIYRYIAGPYISTLYDECTVCFDWINFSLVFRSCCVTQLGQEEFLASLHTLSRLEQTDMTFHVFSTNNPIWVENNWQFNFPLLLPSPLRPSPQLTNSPIVNPYTVHLEPSFTYIKNFTLVVTKKLRQEWHRLRVEKI